MKCSNYLLKIKLISSNQSGFKQGDSCINQLLSMLSLMIYFVKLEVTSVFLDITKTLDKLRHDDIIFKLTQNG